MRVYELAKEYDKKSTDFFDIIREFGINVKSHLSTLDDDRVTEIRNKLDTRQVSIDLENDLLERSIGVKEPLEDSDRDDEETDTDLSLGQKAFAKAEEEEEEEETEDTTEAWNSMKELARQDDDAEWTKKVLEADAKNIVQKVEVLSAFRLGLFSRVDAI